MTARNLRVVQSKRDPIERLLERRAALVEAERTSDPAASMTSLRGALKVPRVLLLVENTDARLRCREFLEAAGLLVDTVEHIGEAASRLEAGVHAMAVTDRLEVVRASRLGAFRVMPHVIFVGSEQTEQCVGALRAGADEAFTVDSAPEFFQARFASAHRIARLESSLEQLHTHNQTLAAIDELTRAASRRFFDRQYPREARAASRKGLPLSLITCDIDHFKKINDGYGHAAGDLVLREFGSRLFDGLRGRQDWLARTGGEEFAIVLAQTAPVEAGIIARRIRQTIAETPFDISGPSLTVTASFGVAGVTCAPSEHHGFGDRLLRAADRALYKSKNTGRNCVTVATFK